MRSTLRTGTVGFALATLLAAPSACGSAVFDEAQDQDQGRGTFIVGGQKSPAFAATGAFVYNGKHICTGTLVAPNKVLTAAHCFLDSPSGAIPSAEFVLGASSTSPSVRVKLASVEMHPDFEKDGQPPAHNDVAVATLTESISNVLPVVLNLQDPSPLVGSPLVLVGYGKNGDDDKMGVRRQAEVELAEVLAHNLAYDFHGSGACVGDSGGPAFVELADGWRQVGVTSGGADANNPDNCKVTGYYSRLDVNAGWLATQGITDGARSRQCGNDGVCDGACSTDADCAGLFQVSAGATTGAGGAVGVCGADGQCFPFCGMADPDCWPPVSPPCFQTKRSYFNFVCYYSDASTGQPCFAVPALCSPWACFCP
jgi:secreted trypsin-like serine protease